MLYIYIDIIMLWLHKKKILSTFAVTALLLPLGASYDTEIVWQQPFSPDQNMPKHFDSSSTSALDFSVSVPGRSSGTYYLEGKKASQQSFSTFAQTDYIGTWGSSTVLFDDSPQNVTVQEGSQTTVTVSGTEETFEVVDVTSESAVSYRESGVLKDKQEGDVVSLNGENYQIDNVEIKDKTVIKQDGETLQINDSGTTYNVKVNSVVDGSPKTATYTVDGGSLQEVEEDGFFSVGSVSIKAEYILAIGNGEGEVTFKLKNQGSREARFKFYDDVDLSSGSYQFRVRYRAGEPSAGDPSESIFFDLEIDDGFNVPYVKNVSVNSSQIFNYGSSSVATGGSVEAAVSQTEGDPFNVTLVNRDTATEVLEAKYNGSGTLQSVVNSFLESTLGIFTGVSGFQESGTTRVVLPLPPESSLLSQSASTYNLGLKVEDLSTSGTRETVDYSVSTTGSNDAPKITSVEGYNAGQWVPVTDLDKYGASFSKIRLTVDDNNDDQHFVSLNLTERYDNVDRRVEENLDLGYEKNGDKYIFDLTDAENFVETTSVNESGGWKVSAKVSDGIDSDSVTRTWSVPWGEYNIEVLNPLSGITVEPGSSFTYKVRRTCSGGECINENETVENYPDPVGDLGP